ncbi:MAG: hypothetical protein Q8878_07945 [Bacillota bacterium]|nr:hypothetical protein [Bacillota bacterium]
MPTVVFKFGGTSVNSAEKRERIIELSKKEIDRGNGVVMIVSAMGRSGDPYATDTLLSLLPSGKDADKNVSDLIVGCGETISACVIADSFKKKGVKAFPMTALQAGIRTNGRFSDARITDIDTKMMREKLSEGYVIIVTGFQGYSETNELTTLGRGGSDTSALAVGGALGASRVVIYSDVPGVAQADPRIIPNAKFLKTMDYDSMLFLAALGAKVLHPNAVRTAVKYNMPFEAKDISRDEGGTLIGPTGEAAGGLFGMTVYKNSKVYKAGENGAGDVELLDEKGEPVFLTDIDSKNILKKEYAGCHMLAAACDDTGRLTPEMISEILLKNGFRFEAVFAKDAKAVWVFSEDRAQDAMKAVFENLQS